MWVDVVGRQSNNPKSEEKAGLNIAFNPKRRMKNVAWGNCETASKVVIKFLLSLKSKGRLLKSWGLRMHSFRVVAYTTLKVRLVIEQQLKGKSEQTGYSKEELDELWAKVRKGNEWKKRFGESPDEVIATLRSRR